MTPTQFADAQRALDMTDRNLAAALGLSEKNGHVQIRKIKDGKIECSGPITVAMLAMVDGFRPSWIEEGN